MRWLVEPIHRRSVSGCSRTYGPSTRMSVWASSSATAGSGSRANLLDGVPAEDHHASSPRSPGRLRQRRGRRGVGERLAAQQRDRLRSRLRPGPAPSTRTISRERSSSRRPGTGGTPGCSTRGSAAGSPGTRPRTASRALRPRCTGRPGRSASSARRSSVGHRGRDRSDRRIIATRRRCGRSPVAPSSPSHEMSRSRNRRITSMLVVRCRVTSRRAVLGGVRARAPAAGRSGRRSAGRPGHFASRNAIASSAASSATASAGLPRSPRPKNSGGTGAWRKIDRGDRARVRRRHSSFGMCDSTPSVLSRSASRRACRLRDRLRQPGDGAEPAGGGQLAGRS